MCKLLSQKEERSCPACTSTNHRQWVQHVWEMPDSGREFRLYLCYQCKGIYAWPRPTDAELEVYYSKHFSFEWYESHKELKRFQAWHRWRRVAPLLRQHGAPDKTILDIGCGHGHFLSFAKKAKWDATGMDYASPALDYARDHYGLRVIPGDAASIIEAAPDTRERYDIITLWHCLEHASDPARLVKAAFQLLKDHGALLIAVPNALCPGMAVRREQWVWCQQPYVHTVQFSPEGLTTLLQKNGLEICKAWSRDTWDAQPLFDIHLDSVTGRIKRKMNRISRRAAFWFEESTRVASYAIGSWPHWVLGREFDATRGSELCVLARKGGNNASN